MGYALLAHSKTNIVKCGVKGIGCTKVQLLKGNKQALTSFLEVEPSVPSCLATS